MSDSSQVVKSADGAALIPNYWKELTESVAQQVTCPVAATARYTEKQCSRSRDCNVNQSDTQERNCNDRTLSGCRLHNRNTRHMCSVQCVTFHLESYSSTVRLQLFTVVKTLMFVYRAATAYVPPHTTTGNCFGFQLVRPGFVKVVKKTYFCNIYLKISPREVQTLF
jgi:hypothetical protein